jgi:CheY-like chemotaxis protein
VAKILVADDNSNVQKTVALALTDLGVEVVAVNNGDAAVRKLADVSPDLVLADIFMPVRNGYEVCEYVKKDTRFSHVPVVLLVGAFDPLDEREAQRVGADGILKKPFVPPDPLITMVKTLLDRSLGDRMVVVAAPKPAISLQSKASAVATAEAPPVAPEASEESPEEEIHPPVDRLSFGEGERPIAFGQLLETPSKESTGTESAAIEPVDNEQILTSTRDSSLGDPIFWRTEEPEAETDEDNSEAEQKERDISPGVSATPWKLGDETIPVHAEADALQPVEPFELVRDQTDEDNGQASTMVESSALIVQDAASQASLTVEAAKPEDLAANPIEWMATAPALPAEENSEATTESSAAVKDTADEFDSNERDHLKSAPESKAPRSSSPVIPPAPASISDAALPPMPSLAEQEPVHPQLKIAAQVPDPHKTEPSLKPLSQSAEDTARSIPTQEWADLAASLQLQAVESVAEKRKSASAPVGQVPPVGPAIAPPAPANPVSAKAESTFSEPAISAPANSAPANSAPASPDPVLVEAVVQRILDKMRPQVVDIITKEFLRPIVQALVHREIEKR